MDRTLGALLLIAVSAAMIFFSTPMNEPDYQDCRIHHGPLTCATTWWTH
jgi:hypothetical protein